LLRQLRRPQLSPIAHYLRQQSGRHAYDVYAGPSNASLLKVIHAFADIRHFIMQEVADEDIYDFKLLTIIPVHRLAILFEAALL